MELLVIIIVILIGILIFFTVRDQRQLRKIEQLTEQMEHFLHYPEQILEENLMEGILANLYNQVAKLEKQVVYEQANAKRIDTDATEFVENMAHQIMNAVTALQLQLYLVQQQEDVDQKYLKKSQEYADRIQSEVDRILKSSQLSKGKIRMMFETMDIKKELEQCVENLKPMTVEREVTITLEAEKDLLFSGDVFWISQALENVIKNAVEHTEKGSSVYVRVTSFKRMFIIRVEDQGEGIPKEQLVRLFSRFHRGKRSKAGYGIGLSMAKDIVKAHHGKISAGNCDEKGAWFEIELPFLDGARSYE